MMQVEKDIIPDCSVFDLWHLGDTSWCRVDNPVAGVTRRLFMSAAKGVMGGSIDLTTASQSPRMDALRRLLPEPVWPVQTEPLTRERQIQAGEVEISHVQLATKVRHF